MGPLWRGEDAEEESEGGRARCAPVRCMHTDVHSANPAAASRTRSTGMCGERATGVCFLLPAGRVEALHFQKEKRSKIKMDSGFRGNDELKSTALDSGFRRNDEPRNEDRKSAAS